MKKFAALAFLLVLLIAAATSAQDVCMIENPADGGEYSTDRDYMTVGQTLTGAESVSLTVDGPTGLVFQRDYGVLEDYFSSEEIYLPLDGPDTRYDITLELDESVLIRFTVYRMTGRLTDITACSVGLPLRDLSGADTWRTATLLDLRALEGNSLQLPVCAGNAYAFGQATFSVSGGSLLVTFTPEEGINPEISQSSVRVALTTDEASQLGTRAFQGTRSDLGTWIPLNGAPYAAVYLRMTVSMDPTAAPCSAVDDSQWRLWELMQQTPAEPETEESAADEMPPIDGDTGMTWGSSEPTQPQWEDAYQLPIDESWQDVQTIPAEENWVEPTNGQDAE